MKLEDMLIECPECKGSKEQECCNGHMCPGTKSCSSCSGMGKVLTERARQLQEKLKVLLNYKGL